MLSQEMELERRRHGYTSGLKPLKINDNFKKINNFVDSNNYGFPYEDIIKTSTLDKTIRTTSEFYNLLFKLHEVYILPEYFESIFDSFMNAGAKTVEEFNTFINFYTLYASPFSIPLETIKSQRRELDLISSGILACYVDGIEGPILPIINFKIIMPGYSNLNISYYANCICNTQVDRIKGIIGNFHNRDVLNILLEKIIAYESNRNMFYALERLRMLNLQIEIHELNNNGNENYLWASVISSIKAEELFDYYVSLSNDDKKAFFYSIQKVFDGEKTLQEILNKAEISLEQERAIPAMSRNLAIK